MPIFEGKKLAATTLLMTLVAAGFAPGAADAKSGPGTAGTGVCLGKASISVAVSPNSITGRAGSELKVKSDVTNCGSATATFVVDHEFVGGFGPNHSFCLRTLPPESTTVTLAAGQSTLIQFARQEPSCVGSYGLVAVVKEANQIVALGGDTFSLSIKTRRH